MKGKRIFITGPSGMGKTTMAKHIEKVHGIQHISTSASALWPSYGFKNHQEAHTLSVVDPMRGLNYQLDILNERMVALALENEWVCDRSPIDNFVYFMVSVSAGVNYKETEGFLVKVRNLMNMGNHMLIIPYSNDIQLTAGRIINPYYHQMTSKIMEWALYGNTVNAHQIEKKLTLNHWDLKIRKSLVNEWLNSSH